MSRRRYLKIIRSNSKDQTRSSSDDLLSPEVISEQPNEPEVISEQPNEPEVITEQPNEPEVITEQPNEPESTSIEEQPNEPEVITEQPNEPESTSIEEQPNEPESTSIEEQPNEPESTSIEEQPNEPESTSIEEPQKVIGILSEPEIDKELNDKIRGLMKQRNEPITPSITPIKKTKKQLSNISYDLPCKHTGPCDR
jgi:hypothetical protein